MNLTARMPSVVSSSTESNPERTSYGYQDPGKTVGGDNRSGKPEKTSWDMMQQVATRNCWSVARQKRKEWSKHWHCNEEIQNMHDKPWRNDELEKSEEALPRLKGCDLEKVTRLYKAKTGVGCDGFHPKAALDLTKETTGKIVEFLERVEQSGKRAATSLHNDVLLDSEEYHE